MAELEYETVEDLALKALALRDAMQAAGFDLREHDWGQKANWVCYQLSVLRNTLKRRREAVEELIG